MFKFILLVSAIASALICFCTASFVIFSILRDKIGFAVLTKSFQSFAELIPIWAGAVFVAFLFLEILDVMLIAFGVSKKPD